MQMWIINHSVVIKCAVPTRKMRTAGLLVVILALTSPTFEQSTFQSGCPKVFEYELASSEPGRWYGVAHLTTDTTLHSVWLNMVLDAKADLLGNWLGDVTTSDNIDFKIENVNMKIFPGPPVDVRFFVQYNSQKDPPKLQEIWLNGRLICNATVPPVIAKTVAEEIPPEPNETNESSPRGLPLMVETTSSTTAITGLTVITSTPTSTTAEPVKSDNESEYSDYNPGPFNVVWLQREEQCGQVLITNPLPLLTKGASTMEGQWPWQTAIYMNRIGTVDNKYICSGTLVSKQHVITAAHCITRKNSKTLVNQNTLTVFLGKHNLRTSIDAVQIELVRELIVHPDYDPRTFNRDIGILSLRNPVTYTKWVQPACLWPEDAVELSNIIGKKGSVVGWGFDERGVSSEELTKVEMPVVDTQTCINSYSQFFKKYTSDTSFCAGYEKGNEACNGDSGSGILFRRGNAWYLRGLVALSVASTRNAFRCDPAHYVIFVDIAKFLPWINKIVNK